MGLNANFDFFNKCRNEVALFYSPSSFSAEHNQLPCKGVFVSLFYEYEEISEPPKRNAEMKVRLPF